jgi:DNA-binding MarR family transcriptional regulator
MKTLSPADVRGLCEQVAAECTASGLREAARAVSRVYEAGYAPLGLTSTQFSIMVAVNLYGRAPLSRLAERLVLDRTSLYRALKPLVRRKMLAIQAGRDRRERVAVLTPAGMQLLAEALPIWHATHEQFARAVGPAAWQVLRTRSSAAVEAAQALLPDDSPQSLSE